YIFFIHLAHPPSTSRFPYTTLFRSTSPGRPFSLLDVGAAAQPDAFRQSGRDAGRAASAQHRRLPTHEGRCVPARWITAFRTTVGDRKSTRLNSSHVKISYAVFCLKK